jgi:hypothetical protein
MVKKTQSRKRRTTQKGGVGYKLDVLKNCKIGGLPEVVATSDCPPIGPGDSHFAQALYGGAKTKRKSRHSKRRQTKKRTPCK